MRVLLVLAAAFVLSVAACRSPTPEPAPTTALVPAPPTIAAGSPAPRGDEVLAHHDDVSASAPSPTVGVGISLGEIGHGSEGIRNAGLVRFEPARVSAGFAPEIVRRILMRHVAEVDACYERVLLHAPSLHGRLTAQFEIDAAGQTQAPTTSDLALVADGAPDGGEPARTVAQCIATTIDRWVFPSPTSGPVSVSVPLDLSLRPAPAEGGLGDLGPSGS